MPASLIIPHPLCDGAKILIEAEVLERLFQFRQVDLNSPESGGILMGYRRQHHLHIVAISSPQPGDKQQRFRFHRQAESHQRIALRHWRAQKQTMDYLGEWHTHPEARPSPSSIDMGEWRRLCASKAVPMVFLIVGNQCAIWVGVGEGKDLKGDIVLVPPRGL
ncbi:Mov34/MPN/PAD-1 family protein [Cupriavidus plantarum]|uniref:Mov34/MPN/PAD-1 family protein n=1 Tax=Cupriavidus plantarum TaxID=942865 RepID=UPI001BAC5C86|nr:Mov34/MPN/PAD-1 family protein [Cupriavidus plantarum]